MAWQQAEVSVFHRLIQEGVDQGAFALTEARSAIETAQCLLLGTKGLMPGFLTPTDYDDPEEFKRKSECLIDFLLTALHSSESV
jgi:hypothetical protein